MEKNIDIDIVNALHREKIITWKDSEASLSETGFLRLVEENHLFNYKLWHAEDRARREDKGYQFVYDAKREIDGYNQSRNNCMEAIDDYLIDVLRPTSVDACPVHSETPGMMIDRLSILALKHYHMAIQTKRADVDEAHRALCLEKLAVIEAQSIQLSSCLALLLEEVLAGVRTFRIYRQFKMYNSAALNPELYGVKS